MMMSIEERRELKRILDRAEDIRLTMNDVYLKIRPFLTKCNNSGRLVYDRI